MERQLVVPDWYFKFHSILKPIGTFANNLKKVLAVK